MHQVNQPQRDSRFQVIPGCLKIAAKPMEWAHERSPRALPEGNMCVKNQIARDTRKAVCKALQTLHENPTQ